MSDTIKYNGYKGFFMVSNWLFDYNDKGLGLKPNEISIYCYLARCGNNAEHAFPTYKTIQKKCNVGERASIEVIKKLIDKGLITKTKRFEEGKGSLSNSYQVFKPEDIYNLVDGILIKKLNVKKSSLSVVDEVEKVVETKKSDSIEPDSRRNNKVPATDNSIAELENFFNSVWQELPSKMKKGKSAVKKTTKIKLMKVGQERLNQCLKLYLFEVKNEKKFMLNGSTWFNGRYLDYIEQVEKQKVKKEVEYKTEDMIEKEFINLYMQKNREKYNDRSELNLKAQEEWIEMRTNIINKTENNISSEDLLNKLIKNLEKYKNE